MTMLQHLEPVQYKHNQVLYNEMEEVHEIIFLMSGNYKVGYQLNQSRRFVTKGTGHTLMIGAYNLTFNKRSIFIHAIESPREVCKGYFIRKRNWFSILNIDCAAEIVANLKQFLSIQYEN